MSLSDTAEYWNDVKFGQRLFRASPLAAIEEILENLKEHGCITFKPHKIKGQPKDSFIVNEVLRILPHFEWENIETGERGVYKNGLAVFLSERFAFIVPPKYDFRMAFGKYEGMWASEVAKRDAQYLHWCVENIKGFRRDSKRFMQSLTE